ncbi:MAG: phenylalanine--tRNA ligase subunit beta [bacterium]|nr:phenylalanine--tRNA ligase subunit beta [bacterium]
MKISYNWLQAYFEEKLPEPEKLAERITFSFAEVEGVEKKGDDTILDIKVLPDRACYALSHRGVAYEVSAILGIPQKNITYPAPEVKPARALKVSVEAPELCSRYMVRVVENITAKDQTWVKMHLESIGQRSINPVVDGANLVMFDRGQPLHAFDADKVTGGITVRRARAGEKITTLDNREVVLDDSVLLIADDEGPLAIAGIKGGKKAEVTSATKNLILESASFDASYIRKTSERICIRTDASKRYENRLSPSLAEKGMDDFSAYLFEMDKNICAGEIIDVYPHPIVDKKLTVSPEYIIGRLGTAVSLQTIEEVLGKLLISVEKKGSEWTLTIPAFRVDLTIPEDITEEVARIIGYDKIPATIPPDTGKPAEIPKSFYYEWKIREILVHAGFSEIQTSSFSDVGDVAILKPLAEDKKFARVNLRGNFEKALKMNALSAPLLGTSETRIFEIGRVFPAFAEASAGKPKSGEVTALAIGYGGPKKKVASELTAIAQTLGKELGVTFVGETKDGVFECALSSVFEKFAEPKKWDISNANSHNEKFTSFSLYPFIVRDVALFVSPDTTAESVAKIIKENAGELVVRGPELFDEFSKDGRKSLAFRMVFQSFDRTLSDDEINAVMEKVYTALTSNGWEVR